MNRYIVSKGWEGFCDRLQCLSNCIDIALRYNRILFVDWSDRIWTHDDKNFYDYFDLSNLPYITSAEAIPPNLEVFPSFWKNGSGLTLDQWVYKLKDQLVFDANEGNHFESVWVHPGVGYRKFNFVQLAKHLRLNGEISDEIKKRTDFNSSGLPIVHLRGTDRNNNNEKTEENWLRLRSLAPIAAVLSDDASLIDRWITESPNSIVISKTPVTAINGGHKLGQTELTEIGLTKHEMNLDLISDFIIMARATDAFALNEDSLFFKMSRLFGKCGGAEKIFESCDHETQFQTFHKDYSFKLKNHKQ